MKSNARTPQQISVRLWMEENYRDCMDWSCNVLNTTTLAEDAASEFDLYEDYYDIPEWVYEMAFEVDQILVERNIVNQ